jgi:hypothetical protein
LTIFRHGGDHASIAPSATTSASQISASGAESIHMGSALGQHHFQFDLRQTADALGFDGARSLQLQPLQSFKETMYGPYTLSALASLHRCQHLAEPPARLIKGWWGARNQGDQISPAPLAKVPAARWEEPSRRLSAVFGSGTPADWSPPGAEPSTPSEQRNSRCDCSRRKTAPDASRCQPQAATCRSCATSTISTAHGGDDAERATSSPLLIAAEDTGIPDRISF